MKYFLVIFSALLLAACTSPNKNLQNLETRNRVQKFLDEYNNEYQRLYTLSSEAQWKTNTYIRKGDTLTSKATDEAAKAMADYTGSQKVIDSVQAYLKIKDVLTDLQVKELNTLLYTAANNPESMKD